MADDGDKMRRNALSAWQWLVDDGGLDPDGRDLELAEGMRQALDPDAKTAEQALEAQAWMRFSRLCSGR